MFLDIYIGLFKGKGNYKFGAIFFFSRSLYSSVVPADYLLAECQANPVSFILILGVKSFKGSECLAEIRSCEGSLKEINIVMLSTSSDPENIQRASELGATFYAVKPSCFERLKSLLEEVLSMNFVGAGEGNKKFLLV